MSTRDDAPKPRRLHKPKSAAAQDRLAAALKENLKRRKVQERARSDREDQGKRARETSTPDAAAPPADKDP